MIRIAAEKIFENKIKDYLDDHGCWHVKFFANAFTKVGIPDILSVVNGYFVAIEVKAPNGKPSELQKYNVNRINECHGFAVVVCPKQFEDLKYMIQCLMCRDDQQARQVCNQINTPWGIGKE